MSVAFFFVAAVLASFPRAQEGEDAAAELGVLVRAREVAGAPGGIVGVLRGGEPTFVQAFGLADAGSRRAIARDTPFYLASVAKAFTAACVLLAAEDGALALDDPITAHVEALPEAFASVTLRQLLHHRAGVKDVYDLAIGLDLGRAPLAANAAALELLARVPALDFAPGERFRYSNSGYVLLAEALRGATGTALPEFARERLFEPLEMRGARFGAQPGREGAEPARGHHLSGERWLPVELASGLVGPGGLWASFDDLARWERAAFAGGWGSAKVRAALVTPPALAPGQSLHPAFGPYAGGLMVGEDRGLPVVRQAGEAFGFGAELLRYPEQELTVIVLWNGAELELDDLAEEVAGVVLREELREAREASAPRVPAERSTPEELARFGRFWREEDSGVLWVLTLRPERMVAASLGDWKFELAAQGAELVSVGTRVPVTLSFEPDEGPATRMLVHAADALVASCRPHPFPPERASDAGELAGEYVFPALGATLALREQEGELALVQEHALGAGPPYVFPPFHALGADLFACDAGAQMQFRRDEAGRVTGVRLDLGRARDLVLERK